MKVSICTPIKNEQSFLDEWIKFHLSIGFDEIYLFEDFCSMQHDEICKKYKNVHLFKMNDFKKDVPFDNRQIWLYNYFIKNYYKETDYVAFIDVDEFVVLDECNNVHNFLQEFKDSYGVYLYWRMFNANGRIEKPPHDMSIFDAYTQQHMGLKRDMCWYHKSFVNVKKCQKDNNLMYSVHEIKNGVNTMHLQTAMIRCYHKAHINHYFTKSWEDWLDKNITRGDMVSGNRKLNDFFEYNPDMQPIRDKLYERYGIQKMRYLNKYIILNNKYAVNFMSKCGCSTLGYLAYSQNFPDDQFLTKGEYSIHQYDFEHFNSPNSPRNNYPSKIIERCFVDIEKVKEIGYKKVAIFRDPIQRLLSARTPMMSDYNLTNNEEFFNFVSNEIKKPIGLTDQHLIPQACYYDFDNIDIFIELKDLEKWLVSIGCEPIKLNQTPKGRYKDATEDIKKWLTTFNEYYKCDYELIDKIKGSDRLLKI